jgi:hypothetical protein
MICGRRVTVAALDNEGRDNGIETHRDVECHGVRRRAQATAQVTFYDAEGFRGSAFMVRQSTMNFSPLGFNDRAASAVVANGNWQVCEDAGFRGRCIVLQPATILPSVRTT